MGLFDWLKGTKPEISPHEHFTREVETLLRSKPNVTFKRGDEALTLIINANGRESKAFLGNLLHDTRDAEPEQRAAIMNRFVSGIADPEPDYKSLDDARKVLAVTLRGPMGLMGDTLLGREFVPCLKEYLVLDGQHRIAFCTDDNLGNWNTSLDALLSIGRTRIANAGAKMSVEEDRGVFSVDNDDDYEAARLLVPGFLAGFRQHVKGRPIAVVPTRNQLYIAGDEDPQTVISLCELAAREYAASPRRVSAAIYSVDGEGRVVRYVRDVKDEAALKARASHVRFEGNEYAAQKQELEAKHEEDGVDLFVGSLGGITNDAGELTSWTTLAKSVHALLPRADVIALQNELHPSALYAWDEVLRVAPHRLKRHPTLFPPRWETFGDFTDDEIRQLTPVRP